MSAYSAPPGLYISPHGTVEKGVSLAIFKTVASHLQFAYEINLSSEWYIRYSNGTMGGSLGDVCVVISILI